MVWLAAVRAAVLEDQSAPCDQSEGSLNSYNIKCDIKCLEIHYEYTCIMNTHALSIQIVTSDMLVVVAPSKQAD